VLSALDRLALRRVRQPSPRRSCCVQGAWRRTRTQRHCKRCCVHPIHRCPSVPLVLRWAFPIAIRSPHQFLACVWELLSTTESTLAYLPVDLSTLPNTSSSGIEWFVAELAQRCVEDPGGERLRVDVSLERIDAYAALTDGVFRRLADIPCLVGLRLCASAATRWVGSGRFF
jgi:hypothetical protein